MVSELLLQVDDLTVGINAAGGRFNAIEGVGFELRQGQVLGLVGESGCGKSLTALALMGLLPQPAARQLGGPYPVRRYRTEHAARPRPATAVRRPAGDDLSGTDDFAQPGLPGR